MPKSKTTKTSHGPQDNAYERGYEQMKEAGLLDQETPLPTVTMISTHAIYFNDMAALTGGHFPKVHYLGSCAFDRFLCEVKQHVVQSGQYFHGTEDTFHFRGVRIIRTGEP